MKSRATGSFWTAYNALPKKIQDIARKQYQLWLQDSKHPSVQFKKVGDFWSGRITESYRALGVMDGNVVIWFWIGSHAEYDRIISR